MSSAFNGFNAFLADVGNKVHDLNSDNLNFALLNTAPVATNTAYSSFSGEVTNGNGYTTGGQTVTSTAYSQTGGIATLTGANTTWTASGSLGPARYTPLYNDTASGKNAIGWYDYGTGFTLTSAETFTIDTASGIFNMQF